MSVSKYREHFVKLEEKEMYFCKLCETKFTAKGDHPREWDHHYKRKCRPFMKKEAAEQKAAAQKKREESVEVTPTPEQGMNLRSRSIIVGTPIPEQEVQHRSMDAAMDWCEGAQSIELQTELGNQMPGIETAPVLQEKSKPYKEKKGKRAAAKKVGQPHGQQHDSTADGGARALELIVVLQSNQRVSPTRLEKLVEHIIYLSQNLSTNNTNSFDIRNIYHLNDVNSIKIFVEAKNLRGANNILALNNSDVFGVLLHASLTDRVHEDAVLFE